MCRIKASVTTLAINAASAASSSRCASSRGSGNAPPAEAPDDDTGVAGGLRQTDSSQRMTRAFEAPSPATEPGEEIAPLGVKKAEVIGVEEQADDSGAKVMVYLLRCTALANAHICLNMLRLANHRAPCMKT